MGSLVFPMSTSYTMRSLFGPRLYCDVWNLIYTPNVPIVRHPLELYQLGELIELLRMTCFDVYRSRSTSLCSYRRCDHIVLRKSRWSYRNYLVGNALRQSRLADTVGVVKHLKCRTLSDMAAQNIVACLWPRSGLIAYARCACA